MRESLHTRSIVDLQTRRLRWSLLAAKFIIGLTRGTHLAKALRRVVLRAVGHVGVVHTGFQASRDMLFMSV